MFDEDMLPRHLAGTSLSPHTFNTYPTRPDDQPETHQLITALLEHPRWHDDCMSPCTGPSDVHGPYRLETISVTQFQQCTAAAAWDTLINWPATNIHPWASQSLLQSREILGAWVAPLLISSDPG